MISLISYTLNGVVPWVAFISMISSEPWALHYLYASRVIYLFPPHPHPPAKWIIVPFSETKSGLNWLFLTYSFYSFHPSDDSFVMVMVFYWFTTISYPLTLWLWNLNRYQKHLKGFHSSGFLDPMLRISDSESPG